MHGLILAGGSARRMGGGDKGLLRVGGRPMLAWVMARLAPQCVDLALSANGDPGRFAWTGLPVVPDAVPGGCGPLAGVLAGLDRLGAEVPAARWLVTVAADTPFLPLDLVARLWSAREETGASVACAASGGRAHPTAALWRVDLREALHATLVANGDRKVGTFLARHGAARVEWASAPFDPFFNVNAPDDLAEAERIARMLDEPLR